MPRFMHQQLGPAFGQFPVAVGDGDQLLAPVEADAHHDEATESVRYLPGGG
jgi:hypothetical protein